MNSPGAPAEREIFYSDELLADGTVHRRYSNGDQEWRRRGHGEVHWRDGTGGQGTDIPLGAQLVKRVYADGRVLYGRELGFGRTVWGPQRVLTVNRTSFGGRMGAILQGIGAGAMLGPLLPPPDHLTPEEEEQLRQQAGTTAGSTSSGGGSEGDYDDDWSDGDTDWGGDDFG